jgi:hypothetical protein
MKRSFTYENLQLVTKSILEIVKGCKNLTSSGTDYVLLWTVLHPQSDYPDRKQIKDKSLRQSIENAILSNMSLEKKAYLKGITSFIPIIQKGATEFLNSNPDKSENFIITKLTSWLDDVFNDIDDAKQWLKKTSLRTQSQTRSLNEPLGKYAFPDERIKGFEVPEELNTDLEDEILDAINLHFDQAVSFTPKVTKSLIDILKKNQYSDIINEPDAQILYRGMAVKPSWLYAFTKGIKPKNNPIQCKCTYNPFENGGSSSWTTSIDSAKDFARLARTSTLSKEIVLIANKNKNHFISGLDGLYRLQTPSRYESEYEVIGLGKVLITSILIVEQDDE